jgi:hypothetical protein
MSAFKPREVKVGNNPPLRQAAVKAAKPRERCKGGKNCSCNDYPRRMQAFFDQASPQAILTLFQMLDHEKATSKMLRTKLNNRRRGDPE